ncbi:Arylphorin subunit alpha [Eumeta japonica]|uniref:Arylphorin subunit alpha n=1 Tax=Eumeta variegata TaxID=151549 RepID=A0A4C1V0T4_EUMVA|nr:Arylphorin subunit alpha [Eumeta japonica]
MHHRWLQFDYCFGKMKILLLLASVVALVTGRAETGSLAHKKLLLNLPTVDVDETYIAKQQKVFALLQHVHQIDTKSDYYKIGVAYDIKANIGDYTNKTAVEEFLRQYEKSSFLWKRMIFTSFETDMRKEAISLYNILYYAKDFETFYKTASWARVHMNEGMFVYSFNIALTHRKDTASLILPAPFEIFPYLFVNNEALQRMQNVKMREGELDPLENISKEVYGKFTVYRVYANYTDIEAWQNNEVRLAYLTEDIGLNTYYYNFHTMFPFWMMGDQLGSLKKHRGEIYYNVHQQLLARYYLERLVNGLDEIEKLAWDSPITTGYHPTMTHLLGMPLSQRDDYHKIQAKQYENLLEIVKTHEIQFLECVHVGKYSDHGGLHVDLRTPEAINFVGNYWQSNPDAYSHDMPRDYYEVLARKILGGTPKSVHPIKKYLAPYTTEQLSFDGVRISKLKVSHLVTYYDEYDFEATNAVYYKTESLQKVPYGFQVTQLRLNHEPFDVKVTIESNVTTDAVLKIFLAPKYDSDGNKIAIENNWMNFVQLDWFVLKVREGKNVIVRNSKEFYGYKEDSIPVRDIISLMEEKKVPRDMYGNSTAFPNRLMLPRGTHGGYPVQVFAILYPYVPLPASDKLTKKFYQDDKPLGYPFDRPLDHTVWYQPNMEMTDTLIKHNGPLNPKHNWEKIWAGGDEVPVA